jgi:chorismate mutase
MSGSIRAIRGATTVLADEPEVIAAGTRELLARIMLLNDLRAEDVVSVIFTVTADLRSEFPARAARDLGWVDVPLLCTVEIPVPNALARCIRVLMHVETARPRDAMKHVYLREARTLRPDLLAD